MVTQKRLRNQLVEMRVAAIYSQDLVKHANKLRAGFREVCQEGKIVKLSLGNRAIFVRDVAPEELDEACFLYYKDNPSDELWSTLALNEIISLEIYDGA